LHDVLVGVDAETLSDIMDDLERTRPDAAELKIMLQYRKINPKVFQVSVSYETAVCNCSKDAQVHIHNPSCGVWLSVGCHHLLLSAMELNTCIVQALLTCVHMSQPGACWHGG